MRRTRFQSLAVISLVAALIGGVSLVSLRLQSARRPRYGGKLRAEMQVAITSLDPATWPAHPGETAAREKLMALVFDRLTRLDDNGEPQPSLAASWSHDGTNQHWQFLLRHNVNFQDGTPLAPEAVTSALQTANPAWQVFGGITRGGSPEIGWVQIATGAPAPDLPALLADARYSIVQRQADSGLVGTGAFRVATWEPGRHAVFTANEDDWEGRPFVDSIDVQMGRTPRDQMIDLDVAKADVVEIPAEQARRAAERGTKLSSSAPIELLAMVFVQGRPAAEDTRVREALARAIDRESLWNFLLQKQGEVAGGLLPQWSSGTAFLFSTEADPAAAHQLWSQISPAPALVLGYDAADSLERAVAERIVVNAREAGISISTRAVAGAQATALKEGARLVRLRIASPEPRAALAGFLGSLGPLAGLEPAPLPDAMSPEEIYARERSLVESFRVVPLVHLPETYGLSARVRDWAALRSGGWRLADVWLEGEGP